MASSEFPEAVAYALSCVGPENLRLKPNQEEALKHLYNSHDVVPHRLWLSYLPLLILGSMWYVKRILFLFSV